MKTNTELLCIALGWQGGTVHQVAEETGLSVSDIINADRSDRAHSPRQLTSSYTGGWFSVRTCSLEHRLKVCNPQHKGDLAYFMGQAAAVESLEALPPLG